MGAAGGVAFWPCTSTVPCGSGCDSPEMDEAGASSAGTCGAGGGASAVGGAAGAVGIVLRHRGFLDGCRGTPL